jgi:hypothetical protein
MVINSDTFVFAAGNIGIEYDFDIPLLISLDFRPEFGGNGYYENNYGSDVALALKYQFILDNILNARNSGVFLFKIISFLEFILTTQKE